MRGHFEADIVIHHPMDAIYNLISHPQQIVGLQPLVKNVEITGETTNEDGQKTYDFVAFEHIRILGVFPMVNRIETHMVLTNPPDTLYQIGQTKLGITLYQTIRLIEENGGTQVTNSIDFEVNSLIFLYVRYEINRAHTAWLNILKERAEAN